MSSATAPTFIQIVTGESPTGQALLAILIVVAAFFIFYTAEVLTKGVNFMNDRFTYLIDHTIVAEDGPTTIFQNPVLHPKEANVIGFSQNERTGIEFAYSFFLLVHPNTYTDKATLKHVLHKGYQCAWPLMGPGVFLHTHTNTMRVVMNAYKDPYMYVDIPNIPVKKWFHVVLNCQKNALEVHINGNLVNRIRFENSLPYQNFGDIYVFNQSVYTIREAMVPGLKGEDFAMDGAMSGYISNLAYTRYALSFPEIQYMLNKGPSKKLVQKNTDRDNLPPYLADSWYVGN